MVKLYNTYNLITQFEQLNTQPGNYSTFLILYMKHYRF